jgi:AGZA family xanthine/uracil permease-like MFS transporter
MPLAGVAAATCLAAGIGCLLMGFLANYPIALAPGMGLNAYFAFTVVGAMGIPWQTALGLVFVSGVLFLVLTVAGVRQLIVSAIPRALFAAIAAGIGLFIAFIGLRSAGLVVKNDATLVGLGDVHAPTTQLALLGLVILSVLTVLKVRGAIFIGIVATALLGWALGLATWTPQPYSLEEMTGTALQLDIPAALGVGGHGFGLALLEILFIFLFVDLFDAVASDVTEVPAYGMRYRMCRVGKVDFELMAPTGATGVIADFLAKRGEGLHHIAFAHGCILAPFR